MVRLIYDGGNTKVEQGAYGEQIVNSLNKLPSIRDQEHFLYKDFYIEDKGNVFQIDHIFVMHNGIFVVETKMTTGLVLGKEEDYKWVILKGKRKTYISNPIFQNELHTKAIRKVLGNKYPIFSIIVFAWSNKPKECTLKNVMNLKEFRDLLRQGTSNHLINSEDMQRIKAILDDIENKKADFKSQHIKTIIETAKKNRV